MEWNETFSGSEGTSFSSAKEVPFFLRFAPIEDTYRIRTISDGQVFTLELVDRQYKVIQRIRVGRDISQIKIVKRKLVELGVREKVVRKGVVEFLKKFKEVTRGQK